MDIDDLTEKEEMALACAADDIEKTLQTTAPDGTKKMGDSDNIVTQQDGDTDADGGAAKRNDSTNQVTLLYKQGNLFSCPQTDSLAHCVSKDLRMGKGIAVLFKQKFGRITELKQQANRVGDVAILKVGDRYIYYLITKPKYSDKPTYQTLETTLRGMKHHCVKYGVKRLSMPRIGCGLDRLMWPQVETLLRKVFSDTDLTITIYSL